MSKHCHDVYPGRQDDLIVQCNDLKIQYNQLLYLRAELARLISSRKPMITRKNRSSASIVANERRVLDGPLITRPWPPVRPAGPAPTVKCQPRAFGRAASGPTCRHTRCMAGIPTVLNAVCSPIPFADRPRCDRGRLRGIQGWRLHCARTPDYSAPQIGNDSPVVVLLGLIRNRFPTIAAIPQIAATAAKSGGAC